MVYLNWLFIKKWEITSFSAKNGTAKFSAHLASRRKKCFVLMAKTEPKDYIEGQTISPDGVIGEQKNKAKTT